jgi:hypothetical protein
VLDLSHTMTTARSANKVPIIQVESATLAIDDLAELEHKKTNRHATPQPPPLETSWSVQHIAVPVPVGGNGGGGSAFNSTRSSAQFDDELSAVAAEPSSKGPVHAAHVVDESAVVRGTGGPVATHGGNVRRLDASTSDSRDQKLPERGATRKRVVRIILLSLYIASCIAIGILSALAFVDKPVLGLLPWGLAMVPLGLFVLVCWCTCWPATELEKRIEHFFTRGHNCCDMC